MLGLGDEVHAYLLDEGLATRLTVERLLAMKDKPATKPPPGTRFATDDIYDDPPGPVVPGPAAAALEADR